jgi:hypothetical protein
MKRLFFRESTNTTRCTKYGSPCAITKMLIKTTMRSNALLFKIKQKNKKEQRWCWGG